MARRIVDIVEEKQASDIVLLDVSDISSLADYFIIATVTTDRQANAIEDDLLQSLKLEQNIRPLHLDGVKADSGGWAVLDYGDVIIHLFTPEMRDHYDLEGLWNKGNVVVKVL